jgi:hypothetical protein
VLPPLPATAFRGKQQLALFADRCVVRTPKADVCVPWAAIKHVAVSRAAAAALCRLLPQPLAGLASRLSGSLPACLASSALPLP